MIPHHLIRSIWKWWTRKHPSSGNRLIKVCPQYRDLSARESQARAKHKPTRDYAKARTALVTELLRGGRHV